MQRKTIGDASLISDGDSVALTADGSNEPVLYFNRDEVRELMEFLRAALETRFDERNTERVPVLASSGLGVHIVAGDQVRDAQARNISLAGMLLDTGGGGLLTLHVGDHFQLELEFEGERVVLAAEVLRRAGTGFGVRFLDCERDGKLTPPAPLQRIVGAMRDRHAKRLHLEQ